MKPRVLLTGAAGVVGSALSAKLAAAFRDCIFVDRIRQPGQDAIRVCDLESRPAVSALMEDATPDVVVHLAGNKDVFALERSPEQATRANLDTTRNLADALKGSDARLVFVSTDYVFEGVDGPYHESSPTRPRTEYGKSKLAAENLLRESGLPIAIARSSSLFGYPGDFVSVVEQSLRQGREFVAFSDLVSNPTAVDDFFALLCRIIETRATGVFHAAGREPVSRDAFARKIARAAALDAGLIISETRQERVRPADLSLDNSDSYQRLNYFPRALDDILADSRAPSHIEADRP
jgi:dTDP-4-dehydrorhamnose reductase